VLPTMYFIDSVFSMVVCYLEYVQLYLVKNMLHCQFFF